MGDSLSAALDALRNRAWRGRRWNRMDPRRSFPTADAYEAWINRRIGARVTHWREKRGVSPYRLGRLCKVTDQTILNIEQGRCPRGSLTGTLSRIAYHLGIELRELVPVSEDGEDDADAGTA